MHLEAPQAARVTPLRRPGAPDLGPAPVDAPSDRFAEIFDLARERELRHPPPEALDAVAEAVRTLEALDAAGLQVRFDLTRGLTASLRELDGTLVRPLALREVVDPPSLLPPDAA
jgi:hypothetical protein